MTKAKFANFMAGAVLVSCCLFQAEAQTSSSIQVGLVSWPLDRTRSESALRSDIEECLVSRIRDVAPEVVLVPQRAIRDALFPLLEPATAPETEEEFAALLSREDVRRRLKSRGLRYLIAFSGETMRPDWNGGIVCGGGFNAGGCLGFAWQDETTALSAALWSLDDASIARREDAKVEGTSVVPAFVLPVPILAHTRQSACNELGARVALAIRKAVSQDPARQ
jgi:hypothetical protein